MIGVVGICLLWASVYSNDLPADLPRLALFIVGAVLLVVEGITELFEHRRKP